MPERGAVRGRCRERPCFGRPGEHVARVTELWEDDELCAASGGVMHGGLRCAGIASQVAYGKSQLAGCDDRHGHIPALFTLS